MASDVSSEVRETVARRARYRCEYCGIDEGDSGFRHQIDHIVSSKHGGSSNSDNLAFACIVCNRNKSSDLSSIDPESGKAEWLFNPRRDRWIAHFRFISATAVGLTGIGRATVRLLRLDTPEGIAERRLR